MIEIVRADSWLARRRFYLFSHELYRGEPKWKEPAVWGGRGVLDVGRNELLRAPHVLLMALEKNRVQARVLTGCVGDKGYFALFDARNGQGEAVKRLMEAAADWQRARGVRELFGPIAPVPVDLGGGILCEGFGESAACADVYNAPGYAEYLEKCGFRADSEWLAYRMETARFDREKYRKIAGWTEDRFGLTVLSDWSGKPRELAVAVGYVMGQEARPELMNRLIGRMERNLADGLCPVVCRAGEPVGFLLTIREKGGRPRIVTMWVREAWRRMGVPAVLFHSFVQEADRRGMKEADASQVNADNAPSRKCIELAGGRVIHRYRQYKMLI